MDFFIEHSWTYFIALLLLDFIYISITCWNINPLGFGLTVTVNLFHVIAF